MKNQELISKLAKVGFTGKEDQEGLYLHISIWVRDNFKCVYCGEDLLKDRIRMTSAQLDHLLPKYKPDYKAFINLPANLVLSCFTCNQIKRNYDPIKDLAIEDRDKVSPQSFEDYKNDLIEACQKKIRISLQKKEAVLEKTISILNER